MAKKSPKPTAAPAWSEDWSVAVRVTVDRRGQPVLDQPAADLLAELDRTGSITAAAKNVGISYRHAWLILKQATENSGAPLFEATVGGRRGGGTRLTEHGKQTLSVFRQLQRQVSAAAAESMPRLVRSTGQRPTVVHLAAAISLQEVVAQIVNEFALLRSTITVRTVFGASNELASQIIAGANFDLFLSANEGQIVRLAKAGLLERQSRRRVAINSLAIVGPQNISSRVRKIADLRELSDVPVVVADPACPLGECTANFLRSAKLQKKLAPQLRFAENSRAVVSSLRAGEPRLAIVFESDLQNVSGPILLCRIPTAKAHTVYEAAIVAYSSNADSARELLGYLTSKSAKACFQRCGFAIPDTEST